MARVSRVRVRQEPSHPTLEISIKININILIFISLSHLPGEAPDTLVPVDAGGGAAVGVASQHHALPQPPSESALVCSNGGRDNNLVTYTLHIRGNK